MLTLQQIFDKSVGGVLAQGDFAREGDGGSCCYRLICFGGSVRKCAVGQLVPDRAYDSQMEGFTICRLRTEECPSPASVALKRALQAGEVDPDDEGTVHLLASLQTAHDTASSLHVFAQRCRRIAQWQGLSEAVIDAWEAAK